MNLRAQAIASILLLELQSRLLERLEKLWTACAIVAGIGA